MALRSFKRVTAGADNVADFCEQLQKNVALTALFDSSAQVSFLAKLFTGRKVTATFSSATTVTINNPLGRAYTGGFIISQTAQHTQTISVIDPDSFTASGYDTSTLIGVAAGSSGGATYTGTITLWVF